VPNRGGNPRNPLERHKVKVAHAQWARRERERGRLDVGVDVQGTVYVYRRAARAGAARRNGEVFWVGGTPPETMGTFWERGAA